MINLSKIPKWAFEPADARHRNRAIAAHQKGVLQISWPDTKQLKTWAKKQGWPTHWFSFNKRFIDKMLENDVNFALVLKESRMQVLIPIEYYKITDKTLRNWDALYEEREDMGVLGSRPVSWGDLVERLREIRRIIEVGVVTEIGGEKLTNLGKFLSWVNKRYHMLEDGYDSWVGDEKS